MKRLAYPIALFAALILIVLFVFFGCTEINRHKDVQTVQIETSSANGKRSLFLKQNRQPIWSPQSMTKPVETQYLQKTPPAETKPVTETQPEESNPRGRNEDRCASRDSTSPWQTQSPKKFKPIAVPVVTAEEAERLNANAIEMLKKGNKEPFSLFYDNTSLEAITFEGTIRVTSTIPDPEKNDYDNCLYAVFVELDSILSQVAADAKYSSEAIVNVPIMKDKTILQNNRFLPGDKIWCTCAEYDAMPQAIQEIQLSDDIQSYEHQQYYPLEIKKISAFQKGGNRNFAKREITILPIQTLPREEKAVALRKERIQNEIARIEEEIKKHGGSFKEWKEEYKPVAEKYKNFAKRDSRAGSMSVISPPRKAKKQDTKQKNTLKGSCLIKNTWKKTISIWS